jgi:hypothetical protein
MDILNMVCVEIAEFDSWGVALFSFSSNDPNEVVATATFSVQVSDVSKFEVGQKYNLNLQKID